MCSPSYSLWDLVPPAMSGIVPCWLVARVFPWPFPVSCSSSQQACKESQQSQQKASFAYPSNFIFLLSFQQSYCVTVYIPINLMFFDRKECLQRQPPQRSQPSATLVFCNSMLLTHCVPSFLIYSWNPDLKVTVIGGGTLERFSVMRRWTYKLSWCF